MLAGLTVLGSVLLSSKDQQEKIEEKPAQHGTCHILGSPLTD